MGLFTFDQFIHPSSMSQLMNKVLGPFMNKLSPVMLELMGLDEKALKKLIKSHQIKLEKYFTQFPGAHLLFNLQIKLINALKFLLTSLINGSLSIGLLFQYLNLINRLLQEIIATLNEEMKKKRYDVVLAQEDALNALKERFKSQKDVSNKTTLWAALLNYYEMKSAMRIIAKIADAFTAWIMTGLADVFESKMQHLCNMLGFTIIRCGDDLDSVMLTLMNNPAHQIRLTLTPEGIQLEALDPAVRYTKLFQYLERAQRVLPQPSQLMDDLHLNAGYDLERIL